MRSKKLFWLYFFLFLISYLRLEVVCENEILKCADNNSIRKTIEKPKWKYDLISKTHRDLPSPHSELLLGMTIGIDEFRHLPIFSEMLRDTGTIHVVVVSGYNVTLVFTFIIGMFGTLYKKRNYVLAISATLLYSIISGFDPPVVRAWFMGGILMLGKYHGLNLNALLVLIFTGLLLLIINPLYLFSLSFILSFMATLSLVLFDVLIPVKAKGVVLMQDLKATLSAQVLVWPIISHFFGTVSLISPLVNMLILWTVPITTVLGSFYVIVAMLGFDFFAGIIADVVYFPLDLFVRTIEIFSLVPNADIEFRLTSTLLVTYYVAALLYAWKRRSA